MAPRDKDANSTAAIASNVAAAGASLDEDGLKKTVNTSTASSPSFSVTKVNPASSLSSTTAPTVPTAPTAPPQKTQAQRRSPESNFVRRRTDFIVLGLMAAGLGWWASSVCGWGWSTQEDGEAFYTLMNFLQLETPLVAYVLYALVAAASMSGMTAAMWMAMRYLQPATPTTHLQAQLRSISVNMFLLTSSQTLLDIFAVHGFTKQYMDPGLPALSSIFSLHTLRDCLLWMLGFELAWYAQHRAMHDSKLLWRLGHAYHHSWKKPEHMIGITNFAFDHVVEVYVTMSSSNFPTFLFPIDFRVAKILGFVYMIIAILVHWDFFPMRYHLNHHYLVTKNYGSHVPIFDMLFGTYQWADFAPAGSAYVPGKGVVGLVGAAAGAAQKEDEATLVGKKTS